MYRGLYEKLDDSVCVQHIVPKIWNIYSQVWNCAASFTISVSVSDWSSAGRSWKYIKRSQINECDNLETEHYNSVLEIRAVHSFIPGILQIGTRHLYWILTGPSFAVQASVERLRYFFSRISLCFSVLFCYEFCAEVRGAWARKQVLWFGRLLRDGVAHWTFNNIQKVFFTWGLGWEMKEKSGPLCCH